MTLRVLHIGKFFPPHRGGMEIFLADLMAEQRRQGIEAHALVHGDPLPDDPPWLQRVPVQFHLSYAPIALGFRRALRRALSALRPDVLHLHMPNNAALWLLTLPGAASIPWVVHWQADVVSPRLRRSVALAYRVYRPFEQALLERSARIIATSTPYLEASEPLQAWRARCAVIPLGLGHSAPIESAPGLPSGSQNDEKTADFDIKLALNPHGDCANSYQNNSDLTASKPALPWRAGHFRLLSIGRLTYYKDFEILIDAVAGLPGVQLCIAGDGELRAALQGRIEAKNWGSEAPRVQLLGAVDDAQKTALLQSCELFCLASCERSEAFGVVLLEAMAHAKPCLVADLPGSGMPWVVSQAGAGWLAPMGDVPAWRAAITEIQGQPGERAARGGAGARSLQTQFGMAACTRAITAQYALANPDLQPPAQTRSTLIVIPARNEAVTIGTVLSNLRAALWCDVLVINDHSSDATGDIARAGGAVVLEPTLPMGAWGGMQAGMRYALQQGYERVITMDADGQHEVGEIPTLLAAQAQADVVVGAFPERASALRQLAWRWFRRLAGFDLRDLTSGFRLYNRAALRVLASREASLLDYQDLGALILIRRAGLGIVEVGVSMNMRSAGKSRIFNSWWSVGKYMAATTLLCLARRG